jgi:hypothetical protein
MKTARRSRPARLLRTAGTRAIAAVLLGAAGSPASAGLKRSQGGPRPVGPRARFVRDRTAAIQLGNALFWDMQLAPLGDDPGPTLRLEWQRAPSISPRRLM